MEDGGLSKKFMKYHYKNNQGSGAEFDVDVGYEAFLAPEMFFRPEFMSMQYTEPIDSIIDNLI